MDQAEWLSSVDPAAMLEFVRLGNVAADDDYPPNYPHCPVRVSERKLRLFACACARQVWHLLTDERSRHAVEVAERFADALATQEEVEAAYSDAVAAGETGHVTFAPTMLLGRSIDFRHFFPPATEGPVGRKGWPEGTPAAQAAILRDIVGDPWRPARFGEDIPSRWGGVYQFRPVWLRWDGAAVPRMASAIYADRAWDLMPALADLLQEAGCEEPGLLAHLRGWERRPCAHCRRGKVKSVHAAAERRKPDLDCRDCNGTGLGPPAQTATHARGCWALDCLRAKE